MSYNESVVKELRIIIGDSLKEVINQKNLSIEGLARECGYSKSIIYNIINGKGYTIDSFLILAHKLELDKNFIFKISNQ